MSLQGDFERCLEYTEALETKQEQRVQAQNNIIFIQNEHERLKNKLRICTVLSVLSAIATLIFALVIISSHTVSLIDFLPCVVVPAIVFIVSFFNYNKTKKEYDKFVPQESASIQKYTAEAEECECEIVRLVQEIYYEDLLTIVPEDYFSVAAIEFCLTRVRKKMADTAAEAFQQLEDEIKRLEQMEYLEQMNAAQMEQLDEIKRAIHVHTLIALAERNRKTS